MPRSKVAPEARRRVSQACGPCKASKQKCDGQWPCALCVRRGRTPSCIYSSPAQPGWNNDAPQTPISQPTPRGSSSPPRSQQQREPSAASASTDVDAPVPKTIRMLKDSKGKSMYIGDSAALSFLQIIRRLVESRMGPSRFTTDPVRHSMLELTDSNQPYPADAHYYPDYNYAFGTASVYFASTSGLLCIFDANQFMADLKSWINGHFPTSTPSSAIFYLVMAIGAQARSTHALDERRAHLYFERGGQLACMGLMDEPSISCIQAFILRTYYMLAACRRNGAYLSLGIAARAAYAMGLHRQVANAAFGDAEAALRGRIWNSLRLLDLIISSTLGRPASTSAAETDIEFERFTSASINEARMLPVMALNECTKVFALVERIMCDVYRHKVVSTRKAEALSKKLQEWTLQLPKELRGLPTGDDSFGLEAQSQEAVLAKANVAFSYYYAMMLLMRPFLIYQLKQQQVEGQSGPAPAAASIPAIDKSAEACVDSAIYMLDLMYKLLKSGMLFNNMTIWIAWVFAAGLVVGLAFFGKVGPSSDLERCLNYAIAICEHFSTSSEQAQRYRSIITTFMEACKQHHQTLMDEAPESSRKLVSKIFEFEEGACDRSRATVREWQMNAIDDASAFSGNDELTSTVVEMDSSGPVESFLGQDFVFATSGELISDSLLDGLALNFDGDSSRRSLIAQAIDTGQFGDQLLDYEPLFGVHTGE